VSQCSSWFILANETKKAHLKGKIRITARGTREGRKPHKGKKEEGGIIKTTR